MAAAGLVVCAMSVAAAPSPGEAGARLQQAEALLSSGHVRQAIAQLDGLGELDDGVVAARVRALLARAFLAGGELQPAQEAADGALILARAHGLEALEHQAMMVAAIAAYRQGEIRRARSLLETVSAATSVALVKAAALLNLAHVAAAAGEPAGVRDVLDEAAAAATGITAARLRSGTQLRLSRATLDLLASRADALNLAQAALASAPPRADRLRSEIHGQLALLQLDEADPSSALDNVRAALGYASTLGARDLSYRWEHLLGRILQLSGAHADAAKAYRRALTDLEPIRSDVLAHATARGESFRDGAGSVYLDYAGMLLEQGGNVDAARNIAETLKAAELEAYYQDDCVTAWQARNRGIENIAPGTAVLYPLVLPRRLELVLTTREEVHRASVALARDELRSLVLELRRNVEKRTTRQYLVQAQRLYDLLLRPFEAPIGEAGVDTLVFVPDDALSSFPIAMLHDGDAFVVERFAVATSPGLSLTDPQPLPRDNLRTLALGISKPAAGFAPLPFVAEEIDSLAERLDAVVLTDDAFRIERFRETLAGERFDIVHLATHGQFRGRNEDTFILAGDGLIDMDMLAEFLGSTRYRKRPVELLTLSACQTAVGDDRAALGLAGIAIKSGARSALASLWYINDQASGRLIDTFYRNLLELRLNKAQALAEAQRRMLSERRYRHPGYWAPFLLIGNWL